ncbi:protein turtle B-like protein, partial [Leptotrombidium deliense]
PVTNIYITDDNETVIDTIAGPYNEGSTINITCRSKGGKAIKKKVCFIKSHLTGKPLPSLTWFHDSSAIDGQLSSASPAVSNCSETRLTLSLTRNDLMTSLKCRAINSNLTSALQKTIVIDLNQLRNKKVLLRSLFSTVKPKDVKIISKQETFKWNKYVELVCESRGSKPSADIFWFTDNDVQKALVSSQHSSEDGFRTTSFLTYLPSIEDNGKRLYCVAVNNQMPDFQINNSFVMNVECKLKIDAIQVMFLTLFVTG